MKARVSQRLVLLVVAIAAVSCLLPGAVWGAGKTIKIAVVAPSASNDLAFTQSIVDGLNAVKKDRPIELAVTDGTFVVADAAAAIRLGGNSRNAARAYATRSKIYKKLGHREEEGDRDRQDGEWLPKEESTTDGWIGPRDLPGDDHGEGNGDHRLRAIEGGAQ